MPMSAWNNAQEAVGFIRTVKPKTVLDIGVGFGKWGYLIRGSVEAEALKIDIKDREIKIHGVEACHQYLLIWNQLLSFLYDELFHMDIKDFSFDQRYDLVIAGDVLEHLKKGDSLTLIQKILNYCRSFIFVIPMGKEWLKGNQKHIEANPYQEHKCFWRNEELMPIFRNAGFKVQLHSTQINRKPIHTYLGEKI